MLDKTKSTVFIKEEITDATALPPRVFKGDIFYNNDGRQVGTNNNPFFNIKSMSFNPSNNYNNMQNIRYTTHNEISNIHNQTAEKYIGHYEHIWSTSNQTSREYGELYNIPFSEIVAIECFNIIFRLPTYDNLNSNKLTCVDLYNPSNSDEAVTIIFGNKKLYIYNETYLDYNNRRQYMPCYPFTIYYLEV